MKKIINPISINPHPPGCRTRLRHFLADPYTVVNGVSLLTSKRFIAEWGRLHIAHQYPPWHGGVQWGGRRGHHVGWLAGGRWVCCHLLWWGGSWLRPGSFPWRCRHDPVFLWLVWKYFRLTADITRGDYNSQLTPQEIITTVSWYHKRWLQLTSQEVIRTVSWHHKR